jgi:hypothetical protein
MVGHTFAGTTVRSLLGLEPEQAAFHRFRAHRRRERESLLPSGSIPPAAGFTSENVARAS